MAFPRGVVLSLLVAGLIALPVATAAPAEIDLVGALPLRAAGPSTTDADGDLTLLFQTTGGSVAWSLAGDDLRLVEVEVWEEMSDRPVNPNSGVRTTEHHLSDARLHLVERLEGFTMLSWTEAGTATTSILTDAPPGPEDGSWMATPDLRVFSLGAPLEVSAPLSESDVEDDLRTTVLGRPVPFRHSVAPGALHLQAPTAQHALTGDLSAYLSGAHLRVDHSDGMLDTRATTTVETRSGSVYLPDEGWVGPGTHQERIVRYVQLAAPEAAMRLATVSAPAALFADGLDMTIDGHLAVPHASGTVTFDDGDRTVDARRLVLSGDVVAAVTPGAGSGSASVSGTGDVTYLRLGGTSETFPVGGVAAAAGLALLAALAVTLWQNGLLAVPFFSRMAKDDVLEHETRGSIFAAIRASPGIAPHDLVTSTGIGWSTTMYHLNVLERNELVIAIRDGRYRRYFDRTSGRFANGRKQIVSVLKNETTGAIAQHIRDHPGAVQRHIASRFQLAASTVHWHVKRLVDVGLVEKERRAQVVALFPGPAWDKVEDADLAMVLDAAPSVRGDAGVGGPSLA